MIFPFVQYSLIFNFDLYMIWHYVSILLKIIFPLTYHCLGLAIKMLFLVKDKEYDSTILRVTESKLSITLHSTKIIIGYSCHTVHLSPFFVSLERKLKVILMPKTDAVKNSKATWGTAAIKTFHAVPFLCYCRCC